MKKVAFISSHPHRLGGVETITLNLIREFKSSFSNQYEFTFIAPYLFDPSSDNFVNEPKDIDRVRIINLTMSKEKDIINELKIILENEKFDIVVASKTDFGVFISKIKGLKEQPIKIMWWHSNPKFILSNNGPYVKYQRYIRKKISKRIDGFITLTNNLQDSFKKSYNIESKRIYNSTKLIGLNKKTEIKKVKNIGYVGRLVEASKQVSHIIKGFSSANNDLELYIYGKGTDRKAYKRSCAKLERIYFMERVDNKDEIYDNIDVLVLTSKHEGFGLVIIEAFARGIPVIAYDIENINEIITHNVNGILVEPNNIDKLTEAINFISSDMDLYHRLSKNAFESSMKYDEKKLVIEWHEYFNELLKKKK